MERKQIEVENQEDGGKYFASVSSSCPRFSSGCTILDCALGGGWAEGRILNVVGDRATGKTLLVEEAIANFAYKHTNGLIKYRETEKAFDTMYAENLGIPLSRIDFDEENPCYTVEDVFEDIKKFCAKCKKAKVKGVYVLDSLDAVSSEAEMSKEFGAATMGGNKAKDISQLFRMLNQAIAESDVTVFFVSQVRDAIGVTFGRSTTRSGGRALDFYASQIVFLANLGRISVTIKGVTRPIGNNIRVKIDKLKVGLPYRECDFPILYSYGMDDLEASINWLVSVKKHREIVEDADEAEEEESKGDAEKKVKDPKEITTYKKQLKKMSDVDYNREKDKVSKVVRRVWNDIESSFLPTRKKYLQK